MATDPPESVDEDTGEITTPVIRPFADFLLEHNKGLTHGELSDALHELVAAVTDTGKAGKLQLTINVAPMKKSGNGVLLVSDVIALKKPAPERKESLFFPDEHGNLTRNDPNQPMFETLREVPETEKTMRAVPVKKERA